MVSCSGFGLPLHAQLLRLFVTTSIKDPELHISFHKYTNTCTMRFENPRLKTYRCCTRPEQVEQTTVSGLKSDGVDVTPEAPDSNASTDASASPEDRAFML